MLKMLMMAIIGFQGLFAGLSAVETESGKKEVRENLQKFTDAVNQGNVDVLSSFWTEDAEFYKPTTGELIEGRKAIDEFLRRIGKEIKERNLKFSFVPAEINFPQEDEAIVMGVVEITDKGALLQRTARRVSLIKQNGKWYINTVREIEVEPAPPQYTNLKDLEWLLGNWKDEDEDVTITFNTEWDKYKNFIKQHFKMKVYGLEAMEGMHIIGWDPVEGKVRSWIFDSDGGFGSGTWSGKGDSWQIALNYTLSDGKKASATQIYKKVSANSYSFSSKDRKINGEAIPDVDTVTLVKEAL